MEPKPPEQAPRPSTPVTFGFTRFCPTCLDGYGDDANVCPKDGTRLVVAKDRDLTGQLLDGRYQIARVLGMGGMGIVYLAHQRLIDRPVAVKVMRWGQIQPGEGVRRFLNEVKAATALRNPHTVVIHDFGVSTDGFLYYTMELLEGEPLSQLLKREKTLPFPPAAMLILQACQSVGEAHQKGILHRDLKPDNLFLLKQEQGHFVKVLDFGIAKRMNKGASDPHLTRTGTVFGTGLYMSPEQAMGSAVDPRSDIYSLGTILFEMLAGRPPFAGENIQQVLVSKVTTDPPKLRTVYPVCPVTDAVEEFVDRLIARDAARRPPTMETLCRELQLLVDTGGRGVVTTVPAAAQPRIAGPGPEAVSEPGIVEEETEALPKAHRGWWVGLAAVVVLAAIAGLLYLFGPWNRERPAMLGSGDAAGGAPARAGTPVRALPAVSPAAAAGAEVRVAAPDAGARSADIRAQTADAQPKAPEVRAAAPDAHAASQEARLQPVEVKHAADVKPVAPAVEPAVVSPVPDVATPTADAGPSEALPKEKVPGPEKSVDKPDKKPDKRPDPKPDREPDKMPEEKPDKKPEEKPSELMEKYDKI